MELIIKLKAIHQKMKESLAVRLFVCLLLFLPSLAVGVVFFILFRLIGVKLEVPLFLNFLIAGLFFVVATLISLLSAIYWNFEFYLNSKYYPNLGVDLIESNPIGLKKDIKIYGIVLILLFIYLILDFPKIFNWDSILIVLATLIIAVRIALSSLRLKEIKQKKKKGKKKFP